MPRNPRFYCAFVRSTLVNKLNRTDIYWGALRQPAMASIVQDEEEPAEDKEDPATTELRRRDRRRLTTMDPHGPKDDRVPIPPLCVSFLHAAADF
jgi:hypothetical protein